MFFFTDLESKFHCGSFLFTEKSRKRHWKELEAKCTSGDRSGSTSTNNPGEPFQLQKPVQLVFTQSYTTKVLCKENAPLMPLLRSERTTGALAIVNHHTHPLGIEWDRLRGV